MHRRFFLGKALFALAITCWLLPVGHAQDAKARKEVLQLNDVTGKAVVLIAPSNYPPDSKETKELIAAGLTMARGSKPALSYNGALILGRIATEAKNLDAADVFFRIAADKAAKLQSHTKLLESYGSWIDAYYDSGKYADAARVCKDLLDLKTDDGKERIILRAFTDDATGETDYDKDVAFDAARRLRMSVKRIYIRSLSKQGKHDQALKLADELIKENRDHWIGLELKGQVLHQAGRYEEAARTFEEVLRRVAKDPDLKDEERDEFLEKYRYSLASILIDLNKVDQASGLLQKLIETNPRNPSYYNDLGYIWADKNMRLTEAEKLIRKALELERELRKKMPDLSPADDHDNGAYLDSLGWVLFRQKRYKEARETLEKAVEDKSAQHIEIYDHLGDACEALGDRQGAVEAWRKGLESASDSRRDQERKALVEKKLEKYK